MEERIIHEDGAMVFENKDPLRISPEGPTQIIPKKKERKEPETKDNYYEGILNQISRSQSAQRWSRPRTRKDYEEQWETTMALWEISKLLFKGETEGQSNCQEWVKAYQQNKLDRQEIISKYCEAMVHLGILFHSMWPLLEPLCEHPEGRSPELDLLIIRQAKYRTIKEHLEHHFSWLKRSA